jgi:hypothetical protein
VDSATDRVAEAPVGRFELAVDVRRRGDCAWGEGDEESYREGEFGGFYVMIACVNRCFTDRDE